MASMLPTICFAGACWALKNLPWATAGHVALEFGSNLLFDMSTFTHEISQIQNIMAVQENLLRRADILMKQNGIYSLCAIDNARKVYSETEKFLENVLPQVVPFLEGDFIHKARRTMLIKQLSYYRREGHRLLSRLGLANEQINMDLTQLLLLSSQLQRARELKDGFAIEESERANGVYATCPEININGKLDLTERNDVFYDSSE
jgi:hypothetical protein